MIRLKQFKVHCDSYEKEWLIQDLKEDVEEMIYDGMTEVECMTLLESWFGNFPKFQVEYAESN